VSPQLQTLADALWQAQQGGTPAEPLPGLSLPDAYAVAACNYARRLAAGQAPVGRKIGHANPANWPAQGLTAPSWGWLYASTCWADRMPSTAASWREPKVELELVLRLGTTPAANLPATDTAGWSACIDAIALGLEFVDRPYPQWGGSVADSVAAGGVHAGLFLAPWQGWPADGALACTRLSAELTVGDTTQRGGSALVMGSPLRAVALLQASLAAQGAPLLQTGEWITTGALAPALPWRLGQAIRAQIDDGAGLRLTLSL
jgi:2-keto-4-pentenoate hydratase